MPQSLNCPSCSAPLDVKDSDSTTIRCPYCNTSVIVPEELHPKTLGSSATSSFHAPFSSSPQVDIHDKLEFIREMALAGNKMVAVRAMRDTFVIGLKQANDMVEAMQHGEPVDISQLKVLPPATGQSTMLDPIRMQDH